MARRVYFSFHYEADVWRTNHVRNSWVTHPDRESAGFHDAAEFEKVKKEGGDAAVSHWIDRNMENTSVVVVCVGEHTCERYWVREEVRRGIESGKGIVFVRVHNLEDNEGHTCPKGELDFGPDIDVSNYSVHDWKNEDGYHNLGDWVEQAHANALATNRPVLGPPPHRSSGITGCGRRLSGAGRN